MVGVVEALAGVVAEPGDSMSTGVVEYQIKCKQGATFITCSLCF